MKFAVGFIFLFLSSKTFAQDSLLEIQGVVFSQSGPIEDVHILNLRSRLGTVSNADGEFTIIALKNDTLILSNIQYHPLGLVVNDQVIELKRVEIEMVSKVEMLNEITLKGHDLKGLFIIDSKNSTDSLAYFSTEVLDFDKESFNDPTSSNYVVPKANLINLVNMLGKKSRRDKLNEQKYQDALQKAAEAMRNEFGDDLFVNRLSIPKQHISSFISYCEKDNILELYVDDRTMEVIDILVKNCKSYREVNQLSDD